MDIHYRKATASDAASLAELRWEFRFGSRSGPTAVSPSEFQRIYKEFISQSIESGEWVVWVAELSGEIIAHIYMHVFRKLPNPYAIEKYLGYISNVYTRPAFRSSGIGATLMDIRQGMGAAARVRWTFCFYGAVRNLRLFIYDRVLARIHT